MHFLLYVNDPAAGIPLHVFIEHLADRPERNHHPPVDDLGRHVEAISRAIEVCLLAIVADLDLAGPVIDGDRAVGVTDIIIRYAQGISYTPDRNQCAIVHDYRLHVKIKLAAVGEHAHAAVALLLVNLPQLRKSPVRLLDLDDLLQDLLCVAPVVAVNRSEDLLFQLVNLFAVGSSLDCRGAADGEGG